MSKNIKNYIIGSGFVASHFKKNLRHFINSKVVIYAAGISNSQTKSSYELKREIKKMHNFLKKNKKKLVYISTYSVKDPSRNSSKYCINKIKIEKLIKNNSNNYLILRFPEIIGKNKNPNTLSNYFAQKIKKGSKFEVLHYAKRNFLDINHAVKIAIYFIKYYKKKNQVCNLINTYNVSPIKVVNYLEEILKNKGNFKINYKEIKKFNIKSSVSKKIVKKFKFNNYYLFKVLKKYYK